MPTGSEIVYLYLGVMLGGLVVYVLTRPDLAATTRAKLSGKSLVNCYIVSQTGRLVQKMMPVFTQGDHSMVQDGKSYRFVRSDAMLRPRRGKVPIHIYPEGDSVPWVVDELSRRTQVIYRDMEPVMGPDGKVVMDPKTRSPKINSVKVIGRVMNPLKFERREVYSAMHSKWGDEIMTAMADKTLQTIMYVTLVTFALAALVMYWVVLRQGPLVNKIYQMVREMITPATTALIRVLVH